MTEPTFPPPLYSPPSPSSPLPYSPPTAPTLDHNPPPVQPAAPPATADTIQHQRYHEDVDGHRRHVDGQGSVEHRQDNRHRIYPDAIGSTSIEWYQNASYTFRGFIDIMYANKKPPLRFAQNTIYKLGLCVYFFANLIYSIVAAAVQSDHLVHHTTYVWISFIGFVIEVVVISIKWYYERYDNNSATQRQSQQEKDHAKEISVLIDYVISSIGELLIYPTLICVMYGFINEGSWQFDNGIHVCNFLFLVYSLIMDGLDKNSSSLI